MKVENHLRNGQELFQSKLRFISPTISSINSLEERLEINLSMPNNVTSFNEANYSYRLFRTCAGCGTIEINTSSLNPTDGGLDSEIEYCYTAKAVYNNEFLSQNFSNEVCATPEHQLDGL